MSIVFNYQELVFNTIATNIETSTNLNVAFDFESLTDNSLYVVNLALSVDPKTQIKIALENKAKCVLVNKDFNLQEGLPYIRVENIQSYLFGLTNLALKKYEPTVVAITGGGSRRAIMGIICQILGLKYNISPCFTDGFEEFGCIPDILQNVNKSDILLVEIGYAQDNSLKTLSENIKPRIVCLTSSKNLENINKQIIANYCDIANYIDKTSSNSALIAIDDNQVVANFIEKFDYVNKILASEMFVQNSDYEFVCSKIQQFTGLKLLQEDFWLVMKLVELFGIEEDFVLQNLRQELLVKEEVSK